MATCVYKEFSKIFHGALAGVSTEVPQTDFELSPTMRQSFMNLLSKATKFDPAVGNESVMTDVSKVLSTGAWLHAGEDAIAVGRRVNSIVKLNKVARFEVNTTPVAIVNRDLTWAGTAYGDSGSHSRESRILGAMNAGINFSLEKRVRFKVWLFDDSIPDQIPKVGSAFNIQCAITLDKARNSRPCTLHFLPKGSMSYAPVIDAFRQSVKDGRSLFINQDTVSYVTTDEKGADPVMSAFSGTMKLPVGDDVYHLAFFANKGDIVDWLPTTLTVPTGNLDSRLRTRGIAHTHGYGCFPGRKDLIGAADKFATNNLSKDDLPDECIDSWTGAVATPSEMCHLTDDPKVCDAPVIVWPLLRSSVFNGTHFNAWGVNGLRDSLELRDSRLFGLIRVLKKGLSASEKAALLRRVVAIPIRPGQGLTPELGAITNDDLLDWGLYLMLLCAYKVTDGRTASEWSGLGNRVFSLRALSLPSPLRVDIALIYQNLPLLIRPLHAAMGESSFRQTFHHSFATALIPFAQISGAGMGALKRWADKMAARFPYEPVCGFNDAPCWITLARHPEDDNVSAFDVVVPSSSGRTLFVTICRPRVSDFRSRRMLDNVVKGSNGLLNTVVQGNIEHTHAIREFVATHPDTRFSELMSPE